MGILDKLRRKKKSELDEPRFPEGIPPSPLTAPAVTTSVATSSLKAEMDLVLSQMENMRMQYEAISSRLQNIERLVTEIRSFCK